MTTTRPSRVLVVLAFAAVYIIWGSTYLGIRLAIETLPGFLMAATRFLIAGGILFIFASLKGAPVRQSFANWRRAIIIGALLLLCGNGGVTWAEKYVASSFAALLVATEPLWVVVLKWAITHRRPNAKVLLGVFIGLAGVALLVSDGFTWGAGASKLRSSTLAATAERCRSPRSGGRRRRRGRALRACSRINRSIRCRPHDRPSANRSRHTRLAP